jgi:hypothetical protein
MFKKNIKFVEFDEEKERFVLNLCNVFEDEGDLVVATVEVEFVHARE